MEKKKCKALKKNKLPCSRPAYKDSEYCWWHRSSRLNDDTRWYNNAKIQAYIALTGLAIAVVFGFASIFSGPSKSNQEEILQTLANMDKKFVETISPVLTQEDAEQPLSAEDKNLLAEYEKWKHKAEQANLKVRLSLNAQLSYAGALLRSARYKDAQSAFRTILIGCPENTSAMAGLGITLLELAKYSESEEMLKQALVIDEKSFGPDHPNVARDLNNLAALLHATNRLADAEPLIRRALAIDEKSFGPDHPHTRTVRMNLQILRNDLQSRRRKM